MIVLIVAQPTQTEEIGRSSVAIVETGRRR